VTVLEIFLVSYSCVVTSVMAQTEGHVTEVCLLISTRIMSGFLEILALKWCATKVGIPPSEWHLATGVLDIITDTVEKGG